MIKMKFVNNLKEILEKHPFIFLVILSTTISGVIYNYLNNYFLQTFELEKQSITLDFKSKELLLDQERTRIKFQIENTNGVLERKQLFKSLINLPKGYKISKSGHFAIPLINNSSQWKWTLKSNLDLRTESLAKLNVAPKKHLNGPKEKDVDVYEGTSILKNYDNNDELHIKPRVHLQYQSWNKISKLQQEEHLGINQLLSSLSESITTMSKPQCNITVFETALIFRKIYESKIFYSLFPMDEIASRLSICKSISLSRYNLIMHVYGNNFGEMKKNMLTSKVDLIDSLSKLSSQDNNGQLESSSSEMTDQKLEFNSLNYSLRMFESIRSLSHTGILGDFKDNGSSYNNEFFIIDGYYEIKNTDKKLCILEIGVITKKGLYRIGFSIPTGRNIDDLRMATSLIQGIKIIQ